MARLHTNTILALICTAVGVFAAGCKDDNDTASVEISGIVIKDSTSAILVGVEVDLEPAGQSTTTNYAGKFSFTSLPAGDYTLRFSKEGYRATSRSVSICAGQTLSVKVTMSAIESQPDPNPDPDPEPSPAGSVVTCDSRVEAEIVSCNRSGSTVTFEYTLTNKGLGNVNDWRIYPPNSMSLIQGGTRSSVWTDDGKEYGYPTIVFRGKTTSGANVLSSSFPMDVPCSGSVIINDVSSTAKEFNLDLGVYAYPNSTYHMANSVIRFRNVSVNR